MTNQIHGRLIIVSNRLPIVIQKRNGEIKCTGGSGGLVTALAPVLRNRGGLWIGWPGFTEGDENEICEKIVQEGHRIGYSLHPIFLSQKEVHLYYDGFANEVIWPLFHDLLGMCRFDPEYWYAMLDVSRTFAEIVKKNHQPEDFIWVHDYHLLFVGQELRKINLTSKLAYFLHIPFPPLDIFLKLPWRFQVLKALLEYDLIGFQTLRDQRNFINCVKKLLPEVAWESSKKTMHLCKTATREIRVGSFPISIDYCEFAKGAEEKEVEDRAWYSHEKLRDQKIIFSLDRLDFTKGIPHRLEAIRYLLKNHPELHQKITFLQVVIPSRIENPYYRELKKEIDRLVGEINSEYSITGWVPIQYFYRSITHNELLAFYRTSEVALITPIKDGMNLVAKEFIASNADENGVLILSEFAGAAAQLHNEALLINPFDIEGVGHTLYRALSMPEEEKTFRMKKMRRLVQRYDVFWWVHSFLEAAISKDLKDFPVADDF